MPDASSAGQVEDIFHDAVNAGDLEAAVSIYTSETVFVQGDTLIRGVDELRNRISSFVLAKPEMREVSRRLTEFDDYVYSEVDWEVARTDENGAVVRTAGTDAHILRRQPDGTWKILRGTVLGRRVLDA
ncbi:nuclear transport factor 2 family protein [Microbacterium sp. X-17]|uniref:YybH family protein n=1 Tax=Microbacterium sp. X-17 TaxID=3144404 RepID=UPI0031F51735